MAIHTGMARPVDLTCSAGNTGEVIAVDIAAEKACRAVTPNPTSEVLPLLDAGQRVAADAIVSRISIPPFDNSAMDGYAVSTRSFAGAGPWTLEVSDRIVAGSPRAVPLRAGTAARIMTGAPVPPGADAVIMQECCERMDGRIIVHSPPVQGKHIRLSGEDVAAGTAIVSAGALLSPRHIALLAAAGIGEVNVVEKVRIGLISTGTELVEPGDSLLSGQIFNSNRYFLRSRLQRAWIETVDYGIVSDDPARIRETLVAAARQCDIVITTGGVSAGEEDHILDVLRLEAADLEVMKVAMRPGKPVTVGKLGRTLFVGLPGNPYATAITFMKIAWPAIRATAGMVPFEDATIEAVSGFELERRTGRTEYAPVTWSRRDDFGRPVVERLGRGSSASLHPFAQARAIAVLPADTSRISLGDRLQLEPVDY